jgi:hypothetical protein
LPLHVLSNWTSYCLLVLLVDLFEVPAILTLLIAADACLRQGRGRTPALWLAISRVGSLTGWPPVPQAEGCLLIPALPLWAVASPRKHHMPPQAVQAKPHEYSDVPLLSLLSPVPSC